MTGAWGEHVSTTHQNGKGKKTEFGAAIAQLLPPTLISYDRAAKPGCWVRVRKIYTFFTKENY
jgi:hypothetical protein